MAFLTCDYNPGPGCDIDSVIFGDQSCTISSAKSVCTAHVDGLLEAQLGIPSGSKYPECSGVEYFQQTVEAENGYFSCPASFVPEMNATGGAEDGCFDDDGVVPGDDGDSDGDDEGLDETSAPVVEPFGDLDQLISCSRDTQCTIAAELLLNVTENFGVFHDEGVALELVDGTAKCGPGAKVGGLTWGGDATELADEFSIQNGDVITHVNTTALSSIGKAIGVLDQIANGTVFEVVVARRNGTNCDSTTWDLTVEP